MDESMFYYSVEILLDRLAYISHIQQTGIKPESVQELRTKRIVKWGIRAVEFFFDFDIPNHTETCLMPLNKMNSEEIDALKHDWEIFRKDFPEAGLRYSGGYPHIFCAKVGDFLFKKKSNLSLFYEDLYRSSDRFFSNHSIGKSNQSHGRFTFCLAYKDLESFTIAKAFLNKGGYNNHIFSSGFFVETWILNLNTLELITPKGVLHSFRNATDITFKKFKDIFRDSDKDEQCSIGEWSPPKGAFITPLLFSDFLKLSLSAFKNEELEIPIEWKNDFSKESLNIHILSLEAKLEKNEIELKEYERIMGKEIFSKFEKGKQFNAINDILLKTYHTKKKIEAFQQKIQSIVTFREKWTNSQNYSMELEQKFPEVEEKFNKICSQLAETVFIYNRKLIETDPVLRHAFSDNLDHQDNIEIREQKILELENEKKGIVGSLKSNTQILYLKGLNQKENWQKGKGWYQAGLKIIDLSPDFTYSSKIIPIWKKIQKCQLQKDELQQNLNHEREKRDEILKKVNHLSEKKSDNIFPWSELECNFNEKILKLEENLSDLFISIGKSFHSTNITQPVDFIDFEKELNTLIKKNNILKQELKRLKIGNNKELVEIASNKDEIEQETPSLLTSKNNANRPKCKNCASILVKKKTKKDNKIVLVCPNYPDCKYLIYING